MDSRTDNALGVRAPCNRDGPLHGPDRANAVHVQTQDVQLHSGIADSGQVTIWAEDNIHLYPHPLHRQRQPCIPSTGRDVRASTRH